MKNANLFRNLLVITGLMFLVASCSPSDSTIEASVKSITVPPPAPPPAPAVVINPDDVLRTGLDSAFAAKGIKGVTATVSNGEVTLTGNVKKADLTKVMQAANELKPKKVNNKMTITK